MDIFCERLKEERENNNLTQAQMAEILGIPFNTYKNYEQKLKRNRQPDLEMLVKIAKTLGVSADYLLGIDEV